MEFFILMLIAGAVTYVWQRLDKLERRVRRAESLLDTVSYSASREGADEAPEPIQERENVAVPQRAEPEPVPAAIPATRIEAEPAAVSAPVEPEVPAQETREKTSAPQIKTPKLPSFKFDFEDMFGRLLPIWAGGVTLAVAGFFLVKYSIEAGLIGPQVRVALGFLFGTLLLGGAEIAYRQEHRLTDPRVRQALAGAGLATLYASFYMAGSLYGLVGNAVAFIGLAGVTGAAIALSFRFGLPSAILGLVGGFAAPMLVGSDEANLPVLALYLALVTGGLTYAGNRQGRSWLALAALAGGLGWGALILFTGITGFTDILAFGGYLVIMGALVPAFTGGRGAAPWLKIIAAALAALQMAAMVAQAEYALLGWGLYGLLAAALAFFAWKDDRLRPASAFTALLAAAIMGTWFDSTPAMFALVGGGMTAIFAGVPLANIYRGAAHRLDAWQLGGFALAMIGLVYGHFYGEVSQTVIALVCLALALLPALGAFLQWPSDESKVGHGGIVTLSAGAIGVTIAGLIATPLWAAPLVVSTVALGLIALAWKRDDVALIAVQWTGAAMTLLALMAGSAMGQEMDRLAGIGTDGDIVKSVLRWTFAAAPFAALALRKRIAGLTEIAEVLFVLLAYGIIAQFAPGDMLAWLAALGAVLLTFAVRERIAARLTALALAAAWAVEPLASWLIGASFAVIAEPMLVAGDIGWRMIALQLAPVLVAAAAIVIRPPAILAGKPPVLAIFAGAVAVITGHVMFKQIFALATFEQFIQLGLAERTIWQALLLGGAFAAVQFAKDRLWAKPVAIALATCSILHFALFTLVLHNPLWEQQAVGALPLVNLLLPAYGIALGAIWLLARELREVELLPRQLFDMAAMVIIGFFALSELRHAFTGSILSGTPVGQTEDLLRSLLGIVLAILFLLWGARSQSRTWRIGSLVLMLGAVLKVFLFDANGLEGLVRVASFVALGFSLIGIGWFYARQLALGTGSKVPESEEVSA